MLEVFDALKKLLPGYLRNELFIRTAQLFFGVHPAIAACFEISRVAGDQPDEGKANEQVGPAKKTHEDFRKCRAY
ncbi:MAG: hypothetical protein V4731_08630 [Pseudomonadota bacterium]